VLRCAGDSFKLAAGGTEDWVTSPGMAHWEVLVDGVPELRRDMKKKRKLSARQVSEREEVGMSEVEKAAAGCGKFGR
jgi:hypothetical protein